MGKRAMDFGPLADLETLSKALTECGELLEALRGSLAEAKVDQEARAERYPLQTK